MTTTKTDLSTNYAKKTDLDATNTNLANNYTNNTTLTSTYSTKNDLTTTKTDLSTNYAKKTDLSLYPTNQYLSSQLNGYVTNTALESKGYVTDSALTSKGYVTDLVLTSKGYINSSVFESRLLDFVPKPAVGSSYVTDTTLKTLISSTGANSVIISATGGVLANLTAYGSWDAITTATGSILTEVSTGISSANILWSTNSNNSTIRGITYNTTGIFTFSNKGLYQLTCSLTVTSSANPSNKTSLYTYISAVRGNISGNKTIIESSPSFLNLSTASYPLTLNSSIFRITDELNENLRLIIYNGIVNTGSLKIIWLGL